MPDQPAMRDLLYANVTLDGWCQSAAAGDAPPWSSFALARDALAAGNPGRAAEMLLAIAADATLDSRHQLIAWQTLRSLHHAPPPDVAKNSLAVIVEVALPQGLDILGAYADQSARYLNHSGKIIVIESPPPPDIAAHLMPLFNAARALVARIGLWTDPLPAPPAPPQARLSFLTPAGLLFGQAPFAALQKDPLAAPTLAAATRLMMAMVNKTTPPRRQA